MPQLARDCFVSREHEFFDQLMRFIVLDSFEPCRFAVFVDIDFHFREIEIERALLESFAAQQRSELPRIVQSPAELAVRF